MSLICSFFPHLPFILFLALYGLPFQLLTIITYNFNPSLTAHIITPLFGNVDSYPLIHRLCLYFLISICSMASNGFQHPGALICFHLSFFGTAWEWTNLYLTFLLGDELQFACPRDRLNLQNSISHVTDGLPQQFWFSCCASSYHLSCPNTWSSLKLTPK